MSAFSFENIGNNTYLTYKINDSDQVDSLSLGMITNNQIPGFALVVYNQMDNEKYLKYNITAKVPAKQFLTGVVNKKRLLDVLYNMISALQLAEEYMLEIDSLLLDLEYIYVDVSTHETHMVCLPVLNSKREEINVTQFFKDIVFSTQFDQTENCDYVAKLINYLNINSVIALNDFKTLLGELKLAQVEPVKQASIQSPPRTHVREETKPNVNVSSPVMPAGQIPSAQQQVPMQPQMQKPVPPQAPPAANGSTPNAPAENKEAQGESISFMKLLMHYNKENAELYKNQKKNKPQKTAGEKTNSKSPKPPKATRATKLPKAPKTNFAAPGFAMPGDAPPPVAPSANIPPANSAPVNKTVVHNQAVNNVLVNNVPAAAPVPPVANSYAQADFGETTVLGNIEDGETTVLGAEMPLNGQAAAKKSPFLIRNKNNERIPVANTNFKIGKERTYVDYFIADNSYISRCHANIITNENGFFLVDNNSRNRTYLNSRQITGSVQEKIENGDKITLANEEFTFIVE